MQNFADLGLSEAALTAVERLGYTEPTPVQLQAIPLVLEGRDLIAAASTGTGKTAAFLLPTLSTLPRDRTHKRAPRVLVVSPTRELASQIAKTCMQIARQTGHFVTTVFGGTPYGPQIKELRRGTDVLIATPGRLNDLMDRGVIDLSNITTLVLDEADRMLDMGFLPAVTTIVDATPDQRQTLLFSATIDRTIQKNLGRLLNNPAVVEIAHKGETAKTVAQYVMPIANFKKPELLRAVLEEKGSDRIIVFARTKFRTEECAETLCDAGYRAESIHSDKSQGQRRRALENFRRGKTSILVATDVLARGIDVPDVDHVINFDLPDMPEDYVHRIGRTGRAGSEGYAISFVTRDSRRTLGDIEKLIGKNIPFMELESYQLDAAELTQKAKSKGGNRKGGSKSYQGKRSSSYQGKRTGGSSYGKSSGGSGYAKKNGSGFGDSRTEKPASGSRSHGPRPGDGTRKSKFASEHNHSSKSAASRSGAYAGGKPGTHGKQRSKKRATSVTDIRSYGEKKAVRERAFSRED